MSYHVPVMAAECLDGLAINPDGVYVDVTFGGGGHSRLILNKLSDKGRLLGFDQDADAANNAIAEDSRFTFVAANFRHLKRFLRLHGYRQVDGILADLGVSSHQLDEGERGFSYRFEAALDMRMNQNDSQTVSDLLNTYDASELQRVLGEYGEVRNAKTLAQALVEARAVRPYQQISDLLAVIDPLVRGNRLRYLSQVFQALRIEINDEMGALQDLLDQSLEALKPGGRMVVMSYHSLEDRQVKNHFKTGNVDGQLIQDDFGKITRPWQVITKKAVEASEEEIKKNTRARSAKLRIAEKNEPS